MNNKKRVIISASLTVFTLASNAMAQVPGGGTRKFAIRTTSGFYLTAENNGGLTAPNAIHTDRTQIGAWEVFTMAPTDGGRVTLQTASGKYVTAEAGGTGGLSTDRTAIGEWEKFRVLQTNGRYSFLTAANTLITAEKNGGLSGANAVATDRTAIGPWETFDLLPQGDAMASQPAPVRRPIAAMVADTPLPAGVVCERPGTFKISHGGWYVARFTLFYTNGGQRIRNQSGDMSVGQSYEFNIPSNSSDIVLWGAYYGTLGSLYPNWINMRPGTNGCIKTWGTAFSPQYGNCD